MKLAVAALLAMLPIIAGAGGAEDPGDALLSADLAFARATSERGLDGWLEYFADDAVIFPEAGPVVTGKKAIIEHYRRVGFDPQELRWQPHAARIDPAANLGFTYGTWDLEVGAADGSSLSRTGKYLTVWQRQSDGSWKVVADIGNMAPLK